MVLVWPTECSDNRTLHDLVENQRGKVAPSPFQGLFPEFRLLKTLQPRYFLGNSLSDPEGLFMPFLVIWTVSRHLGHLPPPFNLREQEAFALVGMTLWFCFR